MGPSDCSWHSTFYCRVWVPLVGQMHIRSKRTWSSMTITAGRPPYFPSEPPTLCNGDSVTSAVSSRLGSDPVSALWSLYVHPVLRWFTPLSSHSPNWLNRFTKTLILCDCVSLCVCGSCHRLASCAACVPALCCPDRFEAPGDSSEKVDRWMGISLSDT